MVYYFKSADRVIGKTEGDVMRRLELLVVPLLILLVATSCNREKKDSDNGSGTAAAKNFTLESIDGNEKISLNDFKGKPVVLNFWASWCGPCKEELPLFESTWKEYKDKDVIFLGVDVMDDRNAAEKYISDEGITYTNLHDPSGEVSNQYGVVALPATFFIDREGRIVAKNYGPFTGDYGAKKFKSYLKEIAE